MRTILILVLLALGGCGTVHTLEELESEALETGDWSKVKAKEERIARRKGVQCPDGLLAWCEVPIGTKKECQCITPAQARRALRDFY